MRAAVRTTYGGPDVVRFEEVPDPVAGPGEIVVRVRATTVNRTDCAYRSGRPWINRVYCGLPRPRVQILGSEFAGVVTDVGEGASSYAIGDRVFGFVDGRPGAHAEQVVVGVDGLVARVPERWDLAEAAPGMEKAHYAQACARVSGARAGDRVLVHGATGAIGSALVQLLHSAGVGVTAVADRLPSQHAGLLGELGADRVVDLSAGGSLDELGGGFDAVVAATGHLSFGAARGLLRPGGTFISSELGRAGQHLALAAAAPVAGMLGRRRVRFPFPHADAAVAAHLARLMAEGGFRPVIDRTFAFAELQAAYAYVETGRKVGNVVVVMPE
ncbi:NADP-dependent oxidoreductase [Nocardioides sp. CCNWLW239]|uniref:quinone oxidoreductase family protein n=1 Tax=Nocardioides sp. CCNWLW239 TaxID=3128902 RepID=UPI00301B1282